MLFWVLLFLSCRWGGMDIHVFVEFECAGW